MAFDLLVILVLIIVLALGAILFWKVKNIKQEKIDYRMFFYAGILWIFMGFAMDTSSFWIIGIVMVVISLSHQKEWKITKSKKEKRMQLAKIIIAIGVAFIVSVAIVLFLNMNLNPPVQIPEMDYFLCSNAGGNWNDCSNSCLIDNQGKNNSCPEVCEKLCECAGIAGFNCPSGYRCKTPSGIADALGFCVKA